MQANLQKKNIFHASKSSLYLVYCHLSYQYSIAFLDQTKLELFEMTENSQKTNVGDVHLFIHSMTSVELHLVKAEDRMQLGIANESLLCQRRCYVWSWYWRLGNATLRFTKWSKMTSEENTESSKASNLVDLCCVESCLK